LLGKNAPAGALGDGRLGKREEGAGMRAIFLSWRFWLVSIFALFLIGAALAGLIYRG
jgi:hypothetical protein